jgi:hypothetical protein
MFGDLGEMRYDDVIDVFKQKAKKWNLPEPDEDVLLLNIKRWERQKAKKNPNIKQNILDYKHHEELYEAMRDYRTKEEEELEKQTKILKYTIITQFDNYKLIKVLDPITLAEFTKHTNLCVQNIEIAKRYFEDYYHFYLLTKDNMVCFIISSKGKSGAPINIATRTDVGIAKGNTYNYSDVSGHIKAVLEQKDVDILRDMLKIIENLEGIKYELSLSRSIKIIKDRNKYYKNKIRELKYMLISGFYLHRIMQQITDDIILLSIFTPKEDIKEYIALVKEILSSKKDRLQEIKHEIIDIAIYYKKYFMRNLLNKDEFIKLIGTVNDSNIDFVYKYVTEILKINMPELENYVLRIPEKAYSYAINIIKGRWEKAEPYIMQDPMYAYYYAENIIKGRWKEAEPYIMRNSAEWAYLYAKNIIKGRWKEAEPYIMKDPYYAYIYARDVIQDRWLEAENIIMNSNDAQIIFDYATDVIKGRWKEAEPYIMKDPKWSLQYKKQFLIHK